MENQNIPDIKQKKDYRNIIIVGLILILILIGVYFFIYKPIVIPYYQQQGMIQGQNLLITDICDDGNITLNISGDIIEKTLFQVCNGGIS